MVLPRLEPRQRDFQYHLMPCSIHAASRDAMCAASATLCVLQDARDLKEEVQVVR